MVSQDWVVARQERLGVLHERLVTAVDALVSGDDWVRAMRFAAQFRARSFGNTLLIWLAHADAYAKGVVGVREPSLVAGYRQWGGLGCHVAPGQHGYMIQAPVTARYASSTPRDETSWRKLGFRETPRHGEVVRSRMVSVKPAYVFDRSQLTADSVVPEPPRPVLLQGQAPVGLWDGLARVLRTEGFTVVGVPAAGVMGGANGQTDFVARTVSVRFDMDELARVKTLAHEAAHCLLHAPGSEGVRHQGLGEVEAESVALMILAAHGVCTDAYTVPYVASWAVAVPGRSAGEVVQATGEKVRACAVSVLTVLETQQVGGGDPPGLSREAAVREPSLLPLAPVRSSLVGVSA